MISKKEKLINRFVILCIQQYALSIHKSGSEVYKQMLDKGIVKELEDDYEDLHGMSTLYLNDYIGFLLNHGQ